MTAHPGSITPVWRQFALLAAGVLVAHLLLLQTLPAQLGTQLDTDADGNRPNPAFTTRSIEAPPPPAAPIVPAVPVLAAVAPRLAQAVKRPKKPSNDAVTQSNSLYAATQNIAIDAPQPAADSLPDSATTTTITTPTSNADTPSTTFSAANTTATASLAALPAGPPTTPVTAISLPGSVRLQYKVLGTSKGLKYNADAELAWRNAGGQYEASMKVSAFLIGSRSMTSVGAITATGLAPTRFADKFKSELAAHFEAEKGKITFSANTPDAPWIDGVQDRVSVFVQLGGMLAGKPGDFPAGSTITLYTAGPREADSWTFTVEGEETLALMGGQIFTLKLTRKPRREFDQKVEIWYAPSLSYLPVRNRITQQNGDFIDKQLTEVVKP